MKTTTKKEVIKAIIKAGNGEKEVLTFGRCMGEWFTFWAIGTHFINALRLPDWYAQKGPDKRVPYTRNQAIEYLDTCIKENPWKN